MINQYSLSAFTSTALCVVATCLLSSCGYYTVVRTPIQVEMQRSEEQRLILKNSGSQTITLISNRSDSSARSIPPGAREVISFRVASVREAERADDIPWLQAVSNSSWNVVIATSPESYLEQEDADAVLRLQVYDETETPLIRRLSLINCNPRWSDTSAAAANHVIDLAKSPLTGVPERLCPK